MESSLGVPKHNLSNEYCVAMEYNVDLLITAIHWLHSTSYHISSHAVTSGLHLFIPLPIQYQTVVCMKTNRVFGPPRKLCGWILWTAYTKSNVAPLTWINDLHFKRIVRAQGINGSF
jgi:hypothetical protein